MPIGRDMESLNRLPRAAPWSKARGVRFKACLPCWFQGRLNDGLPHPVLAGRDAQGSLLAIVVRDRAPSHWFRLVPLPAQALLTPLPPSFRGVVHHPIKPGSVLALVCLGETSAGQACVGRGSHKPLLEIFDRSPCVVRGGALATCLQTSSRLFHRVPIDVSPCGVEVVFSPFDARFPRLTSPKMRTLLDCSLVRTRRKSAPLQGGYVRVHGPIRPITGRHALCPSSSPLCPVPLPDGRATTDVGSRGLTQLAVKKNAARCGWRLYPGEPCGCRPS
jgi:hypothetical protein